MTGEQKNRPPLPDLANAHGVTTIPKLNVFAIDATLRQVSSRNRRFSNEFCSKFAAECVAVDEVDIRGYAHSCKYQTKNGVSTLVPAQEHMTVNFVRRVGDIWHYHPTHVYTDGAKFLRLSRGGGYVRIQGERDKDMKRAKVVDMNGNVRKKPRLPQRKSEEWKKWNRWSS